MRVRLLQINSNKDRSRTATQCHCTQAVQLVHFVESRDLSQLLILGRNVPAEHAGMATFKHVMSMCVCRRFEAAMAAKDTGGVSRFAKLFHPLGRGLSRVRETPVKECF